ncbi:MAG TPA: twin transmembrane helix small protein [Gammaproteobacteria bacterium]|nr:twin transmembrane helix small protein [Gammaproteobacteria bacterium]
MTIITFLVLLALVATVVVLGTGIGSMVHGGEFDDKHNDQLMIARIGIQGLAVVLILVALIASY